MRFRSLLLVASVAAFAAFASAESASANQLAYRNVYGVFQGTRATVDNPSSSQASVSYGNFFDTSIYADDDIDNLIQQGVTYEYHAAEGPSCNYGSSAPALYYFTEIEVSGSYSCYGGGSATFSSSHLQTVDWNSTSLKWSSYLDGSPQGVTTYFSNNCSYEACTVQTYGESDNLSTGAWAAKFAGSGSTEWQYYNGSSWMNITSSNTPYKDTGWSGPSGPFPGGIWSFTYSH